MLQLPGPLAMPGHSRDAAPRSPNYSAKWLSSSLPGGTHIQPPEEVRKERFHVSQGTAGVPGVARNGGGGGANAIAEAAEGKTGADALVDGESGIVAGGGSFMEVTGAEVGESRSRRFYLVAKM